MTVFLPQIAVLHVGDGDLLGVPVVVEPNHPELQTVVVGLDDGDLIALDPGHRLRVGDVAASCDDGVDVLGEARRRGGRVLVTEHDDDVGLTIGGVTVLELGCAGVGRGHRRGDRELCPGGGGDQFGQLIGHHTDEADPHPVDLLDEDTATVPLGTQGIGAGHVRRQDGECRIGKNPTLEVTETMVELVHP